MLLMAYWEPHQHKNGGDTSHDGRRAELSGRAYEFDAKKGVFRGAKPAPTLPSEEAPDDATAHLKALSLDEVSYDRHLDWCSKPSSSRPRNQLAPSKLFAAAANGAKQNAAEYPELDARARQDRAKTERRRRPDQSVYVPRRARAAAAAGDAPRAPPDEAATGGGTPPAH